MIQTTVRGDSNDSPWWLRRQSKVTQTTVRGLLVGCEGVSVYSVSTPLTVFLYPYEKRYARFTTFRVRIFICGPIGRKWMSYYLKNGSLDLIPTFLRSLHSWTRPLKKIFWKLIRSRLGDFWGRRKKLKGEYLVEGHSYRSDTSRVTSHRSSTPSVFF